MKAYNVIYIHTHDTGRAIRPYGENVPGENLLNFAQEAFLFKNAFCASPTCSPSRSALFTGQYPHSNGMIGLTNRKFTINDYSKHLVGFLNKNNYHTVLCGIQHEAGLYTDHSYGAKTIGYKEDITQEITDDMVKWDNDNTSSAVNWLNYCSPSKPFFLSLGYFSTHREYPDQGLFDPTYVKPPAHIVDNEFSRKDQAQYMESVQNFDTCFGRIWETIKEQKLEDNTIIIVSTDHGLALPFSKCTLFDSGIGVFLLMKVPNIPSKGILVEQLVSQIDIFPTLCDLLNLEKPEYLQGDSFSPIFTDIKTPLREYIFAEINFHTSYEPARCVRDNRYKYIKYYSDYHKTNCSNIDNSLPKSFLLNHKLEQHYKKPIGLYDLYYDPLEQNNLIKDPLYKDIAIKMGKVLSNWIDEYKDPIKQGVYQFDPKWIVQTNECTNPKSKEPHDFIQR